MLPDPCSSLEGGFRVKWSGAHLSMNHAEELGLKRLKDTKCNWQGVASCYSELWNAPRRTVISPGYNPSILA